MHPKPRIRNGRLPQMKKNDNFKNSCVSNREQSEAPYCKAALRTVFFIFTAIIISTSFVSPVTADNEKNSKDSMKSNVLTSVGMVPPAAGAERKTLRGKIGAKNFSGVAVVYKEDTVKQSSSEMWMPFGDGVYLDGYANVESINEGDQVRITYDEDAAAKGSLVLRGISLVQKVQEAPEENEEEEEPDSAAGAQS